MIHDNLQSFACCVSFALLLGAVRGAVAEQPEKVPAADAKERDLMRRDWEVWEQLFLTEGQKITKARLVMQRHTFGTHKPTLDVEIDDAEVLRLLEEGFRDVRLHLPPLHRGFFWRCPYRSPPVYYYDR